MDDPSFIKQFEKLNKKRKQTWYNVFKKYSKPIKNDVDYSLNDAPHVLEAESEHMIELVTFIENVLHSNVKELYLGREKSKIFNDTKYFEKVSEVIEVELRKLLNHITLDEVIAYIKFFLQVHPSILEFFENVEDLKLKKLLLDYEEAKKSSDESYISICKDKLLEVWQGLMKIFDEEDIVIYSLYIKRQYLGEPEDLN